jgi:hypothetical protein
MIKTGCRWPGMMAGRYFFHNFAAMGPITLLLITLAAVLLSIFLLRHESHEQPPLLPSLPPGTPPLSSPDKNGGGSFIGLSSFTGNLIALSLAGLTDPKNLLIRAVRQWSIGCLGLPVVLAGAPLTAPETPLILKIMVLIVLPFLAARLQVKTWRKNLENRSHLL